MDSSRHLREANVGELLELRLPSRIGIGCDWSLRQLTKDDGWRLQERQVQGTPRFGAPAEIVFVVKCLREGRCTIVAVCQRPWEGDPVETVAFDIEVKPAP